MEIPRKLRNFQAVLWALIVCLFTPGGALSQTPYYQGKTITMIQGRSAGGTGDMRVRAALPFLAKHIPGNPTIVSEYMSGGGGRRAANHIYTRASRSGGLTIGNVSSTLITNALLGEAGVQYDFDKFPYIGATNSTTQWILATRNQAGLNNIEKLRSTPGVRLGAQAMGHEIYITARIFAYLIGMREPNFIVGFSGPELDLALMRGEVDGRVNIADTVVRRSPEWLDKGLVDFHTILEVPKGNKHPRFANLPEIETFVRSEKERRLLAMYRSIRLTGSLFFLPPETPKEYVQILQDAMRKTFKDPDFHKEFKKLTGDNADPLMPEELEKAIRELPRDAEVIELFKTLTAAGPLPSR